MNESIPAVAAIYEVNTEYHPFNLDNCLKPGDWPTARILEVNDENVLIKWVSGDRVDTDPEWMSLIYFQADIPMLIPALGIDEE
ncbi:MAG: hypothetical protein HN790_03910 [Methylococcales bacterium]|nr:hypothetical protein [Methylococcales bacterium]